jgi:hypothetical protein
VGRVAQSVLRLATGSTVRGSKPGGDKIFRTCPDRFWGTPSLLYNEYRVFPGGKERPGHDADPSSASSAVGHERAIPLLPLWAVRPVQSLSACTRVHFTFTFYYNSCQLSISRGNNRTNNLELFRYAYISQLLYYLCIQLVQDAATFFSDFRMSGKIFG